mgnify:FL=1
MKSISDIQKEYSGKITRIDLELLLAHALKKPREFVLAHPEYKLSELQVTSYKLQAERRMQGEPLAYITGHKEFYGLDFIVNKHTLVPRPETELIVELVLKELQIESNELKVVIDVGTGSGCIITSIAKEIQSFNSELSTFNFWGIDISREALQVAEKNAALHGLDKKIDFLHGDLLDPFIRNPKFEIQNSTLVIVANLPYLSDEIYASAPRDVLNFEPKTALHSPQGGLAHYRRLLGQIRDLKAANRQLQIFCYVEFSPEQKEDLEKLIRNILPKTDTSLHRDLAKRHRIAEIKLQ